jgi:hypothetical protein
LGLIAILDEIGDVPGINDNIVIQCLAYLKASGDYVSRKLRRRRRE